MPKTEERKTAANVVYYYQFNNLSKAAELDPWFSAFLSSAEKLIRISRIRLQNLFSRHSEDGGPAEFPVQAARQGILQPMRAANANRLTVYFTYQDAPMALGLTLGEWEVSVSARREDVSKLNELSALLHFE